MRNPVGKLPFLLLAVGMCLEALGLALLYANLGAAGRVLAVLGVIVCMSCIPVVAVRFPRWWRDLAELRRGAPPS